MLTLPRGFAVYENVQAAQYEGPAILKLLKESHHTGYARFHFFEASAHLLFTEGNLIHLVLESEEAERTGLEGLTRLFELIVQEGGRLDVFRLAQDLTQRILGFLKGTRIHEAQALKLIDRKALLESFRLQKLNGVLHIYTPDRSSMIFYEGGVPLGFFHDGAEELGTSATEFQSIAAMPEAMVDVTKTARVEETEHLDILEMINVEKVWSACVAKDASRQEALDRSFSDKQKVSRETTAAALEQALGETAAAHLGKIGRTLVEKEVAARGGRLSLLDPAAFEAFLAAREKGAKLLTSASKTKEMLESFRASSKSPAKVEAD